MTSYQSWGRYPKAAHAAVEVLWDRCQDFPQIESSALAFGLGRSYGDSCLNNGGALIDTSRMNRFISFDPSSGILRCEAGISLAAILEQFVPQGWFLPVVPGTKFVSVGGAIANDIHGKNHHSSGTFGCHVRQFELLRSSGERFVCSPTENRDYYIASIGGLGLTGIILWADLQLRKISSPWIDAEYIRFNGFDDFLPLAKESAKDFEYTVSWIDCSSKGRSLGRGVFIRGNHSTFEESPNTNHFQAKSLPVPFDAPGFLLNRYSIQAFNFLYYYKQGPKAICRRQHYDSFFFPLDILDNWNRLYGRRGFFQYQAVLPETERNELVKQIFRMVSDAGQGSFLTVLKDFGTVSSPGIMSFPSPGLTLALDFPNRGESTLSLFKRLDEVVREAGGKLYPAKDARMSSEDFLAFYPQTELFFPMADPKISSTFWRRVIPKEMRQT